jgi:hypothetical protein
MIEHAGDWGNSREPPASNLQTCRVTKRPPSGTLGALGRSYSGLTLGLPVAFGNGLSSGNGLAFGIGLGLASGEAGDP